MNQAPSYRPPLDDEIVRYWIRHSCQWQAAHEAWQIYLESFPCGSTPRQQSELD
ncbi:hypothetical protein [Billgrantia zhangzhouensis]|uniref:hypothetical protein n=1 Tax=Billgrantia zhangzhouensis TaxID=2733481 RepID=UPI001F2FA916|nr:hypothetical protein [Halomonas zhangzhouensis]